MNLPRFLGAIVTLVLLFCGISIAGQQTGGIEGIVTTIDGAEIQGIRVTADGEAMPRVRQVTTNSEGRFEFSGLLPGPYDLVFESSDGVSHTAKATVLLNQSTSLRIELRRGLHIES